MYVQKLSCSITSTVTGLGLKRSGFELKQSSFALHCCSLEYSDSLQDSLLKVILSLGFEEIPNKLELA